MVKCSRVEIRISEHDKRLASEISFNMFGQQNISKLFIKLLHSASYKKPIILEEQLVDFRLAVRQLSGIARNLNQVIRKLHTDDNLPQDFLNDRYLNSLKEYVVSVNNELKTLIKEN